MSTEIDESVKRIVEHAKEAAYGPINLQGSPSYSMSAAQDRLQTQWIAQQAFKGKGPAIMYCKADHVFVVPQDVGSTGMQFWDYLNRDHSQHRDQIISCSWDQLSNLGARRYREIMRSFATISESMNTPITIGPKVKIEPETGLRETLVKLCPLTKGSTCRQYQFLPENPEDCIACLQSHAKSNESLKRYFEQTEEQRRREASFQHLKARIKTR
jgi:hypothetical protein